jgi:hypothetical protein
MEREEMEREGLLAGAGKAAVAITEDCLPMDGFTRCHDDLHIRVLLIEAGMRAGIMSVDLTSIGESDIEAYQKILRDYGGVRAEHAWVCATQHTFSAPHIMPLPLPGQKDEPFPGAQPRSAEELARIAKIAEAFRNAAIEATRQAADRMQSARIGVGTGSCGINCNRDVQTEEGWWLGTDADGLSDKTVTVLRFARADGGTMALLYHYAIQPSVMDSSVADDGGRHICADLTGRASRYVEEAYGDGIVAMFCIGAAADQAPILKAVGKADMADGTSRDTDIGAAGFVLMEQLGNHLGAAVLRIAKHTACGAFNGRIACTKTVFSCPAQKIERNLKRLRPHKDYAYEPDGEREAAVEALALGEVALVGTQAELTCQTGKEIREASPFAHTLVLTMVNGGAKYMADRAAYEKITYEAMNSFFACGSAEKLARRATEALESIKSVSKKC